MYQTIGIVRYSGCSGSATLYLLISAWIGEPAGSVDPVAGMPAASAARATSGSSGSRKTERCAS